MSAYDHERPWMRQPFETDRAFALFERYLFLERPRDLRLLESKALSWQELGRLKWEGLWEDRARAWDSRQHAVRCEAVEQKTRETAETAFARHVERLRELDESLIVPELKARKEQHRPEGMPLERTRDLIRALHVLVTSEREIFGPPAAQPVEGYTLERLRKAGLSIEEIELFRDMARKIEAVT